MEKYYYVKIGKGNFLAEEYLAGKNELNKPAIPIYFEMTSNNKKDFLEKGNSKEQGKNFFECGQENKGKTIIVIHEGKVILAKPIGDIVFRKSKIYPNKKGYVKLLPIKKVKEFSIKNVPATLASLTANRYYSSGTFRQIKDEGNIKAIEYITNKKKSYTEKNNPEKLLECLSSFELETLVAKLFEENGCFVPAYRGGNMQSADIFAYNDMSKTLNVNGISIKAKKEISIQIKRKSKLPKPPKGIDYLIGLEIKTGKDNYGVNWLIECISQSRNTKKWLKRSLNWLPSSYLINNGLK